MNYTTQNEISSSYCAQICLPLPFTIKKTLRKTTLLKKQIHSNSCLKLSKNFSSSIPNHPKSIETFSRSNPVIEKVPFQRKSYPQKITSKYPLKIWQYSHQMETKTPLGMPIRLINNEGQKNNCHRISAKALPKQKQVHNETQSYPKICIHQLKTPQTQCLITSPSTDRSQTPSVALIPSTLQITPTFSLSQALSAHTKIMTSSQVSDPAVNFLSESIVIGSYTDDPSFWK